VLAYISVTAIFTDNGVVNNGTTTLWRNIAAAVHRVGVNDMVAQRIAPTLTDVTTRYSVRWLVGARAIASSTLIRVMFGRQRVSANIDAVARLATLTPSSAREHDVSAVAAARQSNKRDNVLAVSSAFSYQRHAQRQ
jgi:hypothetical protein